MKSLIEVSFTPEDATEKDWLVHISDFVSDDQPITWLIKHWIQHESLIMLHGPPGAGKTFVVLDWCLRIASGLPDWCGSKVRQGGVVYLAGEGHRGLRQRIAAWQHRHGGGDIPMWLSKSGCDLDTPEGYQQVSRQVRTLPEKPAVIVVDTLHRFLAGDENSAQDAKQMLDACNRLMTEFGCSVILVHHTGLSESAQHRARGSSAWRGALDIEIGIIPGKHGSPAKIMQHKAKDSDLAPAVSIDLEAVTIPGWLDEDGHPVTSAVVVPSGQPTKRQTDATELYAAVEADARAAEDDAVLAAIADRIQQGDDISVQSNARSCAWSVLEDNGALPDGFRKGSPKQARQRLNAAITRLQKSGRLIRTEYRSGDYKIKTKWALPHPPVSASDDPPVSASDALAEKVDESLADELAEKLPEPQENRRESGKNLLPQSPPYIPPAALADTGGLASCVLPENPQVSASDDLERTGGHWRTLAESVQRIPMNFKDGTKHNGIHHVMRPEHRGKSTFDLILEGKRTATTRRTRPRLSAGDIVTFTAKDGREVQVEVTTDPYRLDATDAGAWSKREGWAPDIFRKYAKLGAWQFQYRLINAPASAF